MVIIFGYPQQNLRKQIILVVMKILIVEDEIKIANSLKKGFEQESFIVDVSYDGEDGYYLASSDDYDLIVLDLMLPGMSGSDICEKLRSEKDFTPIIMLTAKSSLDDKVNGLNCGADDYITKPFAFEELLARVRAVGRRSRDSGSIALECLDLVLDPIDYTVRRDNKEIGLSKKEFILLEYLLRNKNKVVTKDQIIRNAWDFESDVLPNTVEVYIGYLRNKIDKPFKKRPSLIKTVRGFGYKISDCEG